MLLLEIILTLLLVAFLFCVIAIFLSAVAVGISFMLTACLAELGLGHGIIAGAVLAAATLYFVCRLLSASSSHSDSVEDIADDNSVFVMPKEFLHFGGRRSKSKAKITKKR